MRGTLLTVLALAFLTGPALAQVIPREGGFGDRIHGDIHVAGEADLFTDRAVEGSRLSVTILPWRKSDYRAGLFILPEGSDDLGEGVLRGKLARVKKKGAGLAFFPIELPSTGRYRIMVTAGAGEGEEFFTGEYLLKTRIRIPRKFRFDREIPEGGGEAEVEFPAVPGSVATIRVKVGPGGALPGVLDILDPDGESILAQAESRQKKSVWILKRVPLSTFGRYRLWFTSAEAGDWIVKVAVKPPRTKGEKLEKLDPGPPGPDPVVLSLTAGGEVEPIVLVADEEGGPNLMPSYPRSGIPGFAFLDPGSITCSTTEDEEFDALNRPTGFTLRCSGDLGDYVARVSGIEREDGGDALVGYRMAAETAAGNGSSVFTDVAMDGEERAASWTERRTYDVSGRSYLVTVRDILRTGQGHARSFAVEVTRLDPVNGDTSLGTFRLPPWALPVE